MKVRIRWTSGAILPVLVGDDATASELARLLDFACSSGESIVLHRKGVALNPTASLTSQNVHEDDIIEASFAPKIEQDVSKSIDSLALEAARMSDLKFDQMELAPRHAPQLAKSSSDDDYDSLLEEETCAPEPPCAVSTEPLPVLWKDAPQETVKRHPRRLRSLEATASFLEQKGFTTWKW